jgi:hypothetical protein
MVSCSAADPVESVNITAEKLARAKTLLTIRDRFVGDMLLSRFVSVDNVQKAQQIYQAEASFQTSFCDQNQKITSVEGAIGIPGVEERISRKG